MSVNYRGPVHTSPAGVGLDRFRSLSVSAKALIHQSGHFLLQHRDNIPDIWHPDHWGLFGGEVEIWETPEQGLLRELEEELGWQASYPVYLIPWHPRPDSTIHIFAVELDVLISELKLREGAGMELVGLKEMESLKLTPEIRHNFEVLKNIAGILFS